MLQRAFRPSEIDQELGIGQALCQIGLDQYAGKLAEKSRGIGADAAGIGKRAGQGGVRRILYRLDQHATHAPGGACYCNFQFIHLCGFWLRAAVYFDTGAASGAGAACPAIRDR